MAIWVTLANLGKNALPTMVTGNGFGGGKWACAGLCGAIYGNGAKTAVKGLYGPLATPGGFPLGLPLFCIGIASFQAVFTVI